MHSYWQDLAWDCYTSFVAQLYQSHGPWFYSKFCFRSISKEQIDIFSPNLIYEFILTRSSFWIICHFSQICTRVMTLDLRQNFVSAHYLENSFIEFIQILYVHWCWHDLAWDCFMSYSKICTRIMDLDFYAKISFLFNILRTNWQNFTKVYICIYIDKI